MHLTLPPHLVEFGEAQRGGISPRKAKTPG